MRFPPSLPVQRGSDFRPDADVLPTGLPPLDAFLGGIPLRRTSMLVGAEGSGVITLLHGLLAVVTPEAPALLLDPRDRFYPPGAAAVGVHLPHLIRVRAGDARTVARVLAMALRTDACPLVVWDAGESLPAPLLARLRPIVRGGRCALLIAAGDHVAEASAADGATLAVRHERWEQGAAGRPGVTGKTVLVTATDHRRGRTAALPLTFRFPQPLPPLLRSHRKGGAGDATAARGGDLAAGPAPATRRAG